MNAVAYLTHGGPKDCFYDQYAKDDLVTYQLSLDDARRDVMKDVVTISRMLRTLGHAAKSAREEDKLGKHKAETQDADSLDKAADRLATAIQAKLASGTKPQKKTKPGKNKKTRGRKKYQGDTESSRLEVLKAWQRAREAGTCRKDFCSDWNEMHDGADLQVRDIEIYQDWQKQRQTRSKRTRK
jgi:hypothetical protein